MKDRVLIVEDELIVARDIRKTLERNGFSVTGVARSTEKALTSIEESRPSLVLLDIFLKGNLTGIDLARQLNKMRIPFIYVSANSNQQVLEAAKETNPYGFIVKPFREKDLLVTMDIARYRYESKRKMESQQQTGDNLQVSVRKEAGLLPISTRQQRPGCNDIIGSSAPMLHLFNLVEQVAPFDTSVLILGESGTGKEGIANCIVQLSPRKHKPYIKINCAAIPAELMEAELFGYEKGAFTGAFERKPGKFELAAGGTILLDEIGEITPELQAKLLRVLQEKEIHRLGSSTTFKTDVRVLAATSRILEKEVAEGRFRLDLYYRLLVFPISVPPLRERVDDIPLLVNHFIEFYSRKSGKNIKAVTSENMQLLLRYNWPGNIRELEHLVERRIILTSNASTEEIELPVPVTPQPTPQVKTMATRQTKTLEEMERDHIIEVLKQCNFRVSGEGGAAEILNIPPTTLHSKIKKLGIKKFFE
jgi:DNA-binding NtrC family response regulator